MRWIWIVVVGLMGLCISSVLAQESVVFEPLIMYETFSVHGDREGYFLDDVLEGGGDAQEDVGAGFGLLQSVSGEGGSFLSDWNWRVSTKVESRGRVWFASRLDEMNEKLLLREAYGSYETDEGHVLSVGKVLLPWSGGLVFRPLDLWEKGGRSADIEDSYGDEEGRKSLVLSYLMGDWWVEGVVGGDDVAERDEYDYRWFYGLRLLGNIGDAEVSGVLQGGDGRRLGFGGSIFYSLSDSLSFRGEGFVREGTVRLIDGRLIGELEKGLVVENPVRAWRENSGEWYPRVALGLQWTGQLGRDRYHDVVIEYFYDHRGLDNGSWGAWKDMVRDNLDDSHLDARNGLEAARVVSLREQVSGNLRYDGLTLQQGGGLVRRHYVYGRWQPDFAPWTPSLSGLCGVESCRLGIGTGYRAFGSPLEWRFDAIMHVGDEGVFGFVPESYRLEAGFLFYGG